MPLEQLRMFLIVGMCLVTFLIWQAWVQDYGPKPIAENEPVATQSADGTIPPAATSTDGIPSSASSAATPAADPTAQIPSDAQTQVDPSAIVSVRTDLTETQLSITGSSVQSINLLEYPVTSDNPDEPFTLLNPTRPNVFIAHTGLIGLGELEFEAAGNEFTLADGEDTLEVPFVAKSSDGLEVVKTYTFRRNSYVIDIRFDVKNATDANWDGEMYSQFERTQVAPPGGLFRIYTYTGGVFSSEEDPYDKYDFSDMDDNPLDRVVTGGWVAMIQHYFVGAWIPHADESNRYWTLTPSQPPDVRYKLGVTAAKRTVAPGQTGEFSVRLYAGPKLQERLSVLAPNLERTVDFGFLWIIAQPLFLLLKWIHSLIGNWGWSIIGVTLIIKLAFFHLSAASYKSMARMRKMQPRITALRERYQDDKQRLNQAMMTMYKEEKINPLGGCLPILIQIPVFIALYWVLVESVELRQAPFILWLKDLSLHDPYFVLPVLMGITMFAQQKLNPAPPDPIQAKVMMALPFVFTFFFLFFPAGLVLYWFINNLLSIAQQWIITRKIVGPENT